MSRSAFHWTTLPPRIPSPARRHAAPSGPWPWMDLDSDSETDATKTVSPNGCATPRSRDVSDSSVDGSEDASLRYTGYPQRQFPNWLPEQLKRSGITKAIQDIPEAPCVIRQFDVSENGHFQHGRLHAIFDRQLEREEFWELMNKPRPSQLRLRGLFVQNLSGPVLQMLGTRYNIEPFFFSSSLNWIPTRYQEDLHQGVRDHITITLMFIRSIKAPIDVLTPAADYDSYIKKIPPLEVKNVIDTQAPLVLRSVNKVLMPDILSIHMIRDGPNTTLISYHAPPQYRTTSCRQLHSRVFNAGQSVYWNKIFQKSPDPTFVLLALLWHVLYAWDEALQTLFQHIYWLEASVFTSDTDLTQELYIVRASLLHYSALLEDFRKSVRFVMDTPNPALISKLTAEQREESQQLMAKECNHLLAEIERLQKGRSMHDDRLGNVMNLVGRHTRDMEGSTDINKAFATVNLADSKRMQDMTVATVRDSSVMKQISYLTMVYLPASFAASAFGMNISEIVPDTQGTLGRYFATTIPLTLVTICIIMMLRAKDRSDDPSASIWTMLWWPSVLKVNWRKRRQKDASEKV
ncbi:hypothetical protein BDN71DRAFT_1492179 [Pleurotus eryngii]|uniref:Uncharacterized protein n=1 Tax=Pleurotus eryngii TaxID=5323 RepID=A0A9P6ABB3_PLEER|nr:hypothetical protein BDN71DRAFT_1492179 [Pleurotus eryngii]